VKLSRPDVCDKTTADVAATGSWLRTRHTGRAPRRDREAGFMGPNMAISLSWKRNVLEEKILVYSPVDIKGPTTRASEARWSRYTCTQSAAPTFLGLNSSSPVSQFEPVEPGSATNAINLPIRRCWRSSSGSCPGLAFVPWFAMQSHDAIAGPELGIPQIAALVAAYLDPLGHCRHFGGSTTQSRRVPPRQAPPRSTKQETARDATRRLDIG
jgi:hypothetical protein